VSSFWAKLKYPRSEVNAAGRVLVSDDGDDIALERALDVINNWRSSHSFPLNTFQKTLRDKSRRVYPHALVAQRLKRVPSIRKKLIDRPTMKLVQMQDIGGCRAVVDSVTDVTKLREAYRESDLRHPLHHEKNYIAEPKLSGYRSLHLVYEYASDKTTTYNGLKIEVQMRSLHQHAWATAVETAGTFLQEALKSSEGSGEWLRFFALASSAFARIERTPPVPGLPTDWRELKGLLQRMLIDLDVEARLKAYREALVVVDDPQLGDFDYYLLSQQIGKSGSQLLISGFRKAQLDEATTKYLAEEKRLQAVEGGQAVLVSAGSLQALKRAYPNFYLDTGRFIEYLQTALAAT
jgi:hypothetical protein